MPRATAAPSDWRPQPVTPGGPGAVDPPAAPLRDVIGVTTRRGDRPRAGSNRRAWAERAARIRESRRSGPWPMVAGSWEERDGGHGHRVGRRAPGLVETTTARREQLPRRAASPLPSLICRKARRRHDSPPGPGRPAPRIRGPAAGRSPIAGAAIGAYSHPRTSRPPRPPSPRERGTGPSPASRGAGAEQAAHELAGGRPRQLGDQDDLTQPEQRVQPGIDQLLQRVA